MESKAMHTAALQTQFNAVSERYDSQRQALIPCFHDFYGMAVKLGQQVADAGQILDLGAGTGLMSAMLLPQHPRAQFTLVDVSARMLDQARQRFGDSGQFDYVNRDFSQLDDRPGATFDLAVSGLAIHHLEHRDKQRLFQTVFRLPKPGGWFINADQVLGENELAEALYTAAWREHVIRSTALDETEKQAAFERIKLDKMAKLSEQLQWLAEAGFRHPAPYYQYDNFVVFAAVK